MVRFGATAEQPDRSGTAKDRPAPPPGDGLLDGLGQLVVHGPDAEVSLGGLVVADQDALNQVVLGDLDLDDRGREMLVSDCGHFVGRCRLRGRLRRGVGPLMDGQCQQADEDRGNRILRGCFLSVDVFWKPSTRSHSLS